MCGYVCLHISIYEHYKKNKTPLLMHSDIIFTLCILLLKKDKSTVQDEDHDPHRLCCYYSQFVEKKQQESFLRCDTKQTKAYSSYLTLQKNVCLQAKYTVALLLFGIR